MINFSLKKILSIFFILLFAGIIVMGLVISRNDQVFRSTNYLVDHTRDVLEKAATIFSITTDIETGTRGYVITGDSSFLEPFEKSKNIIYYQVVKLRDLCIDNPAQQRRIDSIGNLINKRVGFALQTVKMRNECGFEDAQLMISTREGKSYMDSVQTLFTQFRNDEINRLNGQKEANQRSIIAFNRASYALLIGAIILLISVALVIRYYLAARTRAEEKLLYHSYIISNASDAIIASDMNFNITVWNTAAERLYEYSKEEVLGKPAFEIVQTEHRTLSDKEGAIKKVKETGEWHGELTLITKSGKRIPILSSVSTITDRNGKTIGFISVNKNISGG